MTVMAVDFLTQKIQRWGAVKIFEDQTLAGLSGM